MGGGEWGGKKGVMVSWGGTHGNSTYAARPGPVSRPGGRPADGAADPQAEHDLWLAIPEQAPAAAPAAHGGERRPVAAVAICDRGPGHRGLLHPLAEELPVALRGRFAPAQAGVRAGRDLAAAAHAILGGL